MLVVSSLAAPSSVRQALAAGAAGYVPKRASDAELVAAIRQVAAGEGYVDPGLGAKLVVPARSAALEPLSERERDILQLLALGYTNQEIGRKRFISVRTVDTHRAHIMRKLGLETRAELVLFALANGLLGRADALDRRAEQRKGAGGGLLDVTGRQRRSVAMTSTRRRVVATVTSSTDRLSANRPLGTHNSGRTGSNTPLASVSAKTAACQRSFGIGVITDSLRKGPETATSGRVGQLTTAVTIALVPGTKRKSSSWTGHQPVGIKARWSPVGRWRSATAR